MSPEVMAFIKKTGRKRDTKFDLTIEQIMEMDEYHKRGEISPLEEEQGRLYEEEMARVGKYAKMAEEMLKEENPIKYSALCSLQTLYGELGDLNDRALAMKEEHRANLKPPKGTSMEAYKARVQYEVEKRQEIEYRIYNEIILPFVMEGLEE